MRRHVRRCVAFVADHVAVLTRPVGVLGLDRRSHSSCRRCCLAKMQSASDVADLEHLLAGQVSPRHKLVELTIGDRQGGSGCPACDFSCSGGSALILADARSLRAVTRYASSGDALLSAGDAWPGVAETRFRTDRDLSLTVAPGGEVALGDQPTSVSLTFR